MVARRAAEPLPGLARRHALSPAAPVKAPRPQNTIRTPSWALPCTEPRRASVLTPK